MYGFLIRQSYWEVSLLEKDIIKFRLLSFVRFMYYIDKVSIREKLGFLILKKIKCFNLQKSGVFD